MGVREVEEEVGGELAPQEFGYELIPRSLGDASRVENPVAHLVRRYLTEMQVCADRPDEDHTEAGRRCRRQPRNQQEEST